MTRFDSRHPLQPSSKRGEFPLNRPAILGAAAALIFIVGVVLAVAQPGDIGDDDTAAPTPVSSTTTEAAETTTSSTAAETTTTSEAPSTTTTTMTTDGSGSGLGTDGSGSVDEGDLSNTGGPEWLLPIGGVLLAVGLSARRFART